MTALTSDTCRDRPRLWKANSTMDILAAQRCITLAVVYYLIIVKVSPSDKPVNELYRPKNAGGSRVPPTVYG